MARARGTKQYQPLNAGLITEASPLEFPQGATYDELNFVFEHRGNRRVKRKGLNTTRTINWALQEFNSATVSEVKSGKPFLWKKYDIVVVPLIVKVDDTTDFYTAEIQFYSTAGVLKGQFKTAATLSSPIISVAPEDYDIDVVKVDDERLIINPNFLVLPYFVDVFIDPVDGATAVCTGSVLYYRDFAVLQTDDEQYSRSFFDMSGQPQVDVSYLYNIVNSGWLKKIETTEALANTPLEAVEAAWSVDNTVPFPAMSDDVNLFIERRASDQNLQFSVDKYVNSEPKGFLGSHGSQILSTDRFFGGRNTSAVTEEAATLLELERFTL